jgi:hypothetical protein
VKTEVILDQELINEAKNNPYEGCQEIIPAAFGRAAEPPFFELSQKLLSRFNYTLMTPEEGLELVPEIHQSILKPVLRANGELSYRYDGLVFDDLEENEFAGVLEIKLAQQPYFTIPPQEWVVAKYCKENELNYFVGAGKMLNSSRRQTEYLGVIVALDMDEDGNVGMHGDRKKFMVDKLGPYFLE